MLLPVSVSDPRRINPSQSPSRPQSPTHLDNDHNNNDNDNLFVSPADILFHPRSISSISPFRQKIITNDNKHDVIDWQQRQQQDDDEYPFDDPGSGQTSAVPTRHPSPVRPPTHNNNAKNEIDIKNLPQLVRTRNRRGRSGTSRKGLRLWPLIINRNPQGQGHRSPSNSRKTWINLGPQKTQSLKTVGVDVCLRWVTEDPKPRILPPLPPTPPPTPAEGEQVVQFDNVLLNDVVSQETSSPSSSSKQEKLLQIVQDALHHVQSTLETLGVDQNNLYLHTQHYLTIADADIDSDMFLLEGKMADLEECSERIKVLRDDILYVHRWHLNSPTRNGHASENGGDSDGGEEVQVGTFAFTERDVIRRLRACFEPSTWWKDYDFGFGKEQAGFVQDEEEFTDDEDSGLESDESSSEEED